MVDKFSILVKQFKQMTVYGLVILLKNKYLPLDEYYIFRQKSQYFHKQNRITIK